MKYNYPVKYALMPIIEQVGWTYGVNELERKYDVVCYIVSKCYLLSDKTKYERDGKKEKEYEVLFPYQKEYHYCFKRVNPSFNLLNYNCTDSEKVEEVFDNYEEALDKATLKNKELCDKTLLYLPYSEDLDEKISNKIEEFNDKLSMYKMLEQQILINTSDLEPSNVKELKYLIINDKGKFKVFKSDLYGYLGYNSNFIIYSISEEQYNKLVTSINNKDKIDSSSIKDAIPILYHKENDKNIMIINQNGEIINYLNEWKNLRNSDELKESTVNLNTNEKTEYIYTTETLKDILLSFSTYKYINIDQIQGPVLKKTLFDKK